MWKCVSARIIIPLIIFFVTQIISRLYIFESCMTIKYEDIYLTFSTNNLAKKYISLRCILKIQGFFSSSSFAAIYLHLHITICDVALSKSTINMSGWNYIFHNMHLITSRHLEGVTLPLSWSNEIRVILLSKIPSYSSNYDFNFCHYVIYKKLKLDVWSLLK